MKTGLLIVVVALFSVTVLLFGVMYDLTYVDDRELRTDSMNPKISLFDKNAYVVWSEANNSEFFDVYLRKITDGNLIGEYVNLTQGKSFYPRPQVLSSENNVYVLWEDRADKHGYDGDTIYFTKSKNHGQTFDETTVLGASSLDSISHTPITMRYVSGILHVFMFQWNPQTDETVIVFRSSHDGGNTFGKPVSFFEFDKKYPALFDVLAVNDTAYAVSGSYHGHSDESGEIHFRKIHPDGNLSDVINLNKTEHFVNSLDILATEDGKDVYVVSMELANERKPGTGLVLEKPSLFFTKSHDGGNIFGKPVKVNTDLNSGGVETQSIQASSYDDSVYLMWNEVYFDENDRFHRTLYAKSNDRGETFDIAMHPLDELRSKYGQIHTYGKNGILYFITISKMQSFHEDGTMYFAKSDDGGVTISQVIDVTGGTLSFADAPKVSMHENNIQIIADVMHDKNCILYISSNDAGNSFSEPLNLSPNGSLEDCFAG